MASSTSIDRLVRKEVSLGVIREIQKPRTFIGLDLAPFLEVGTDDVIFDYIGAGLQEGLAPARAEDSEAELAQKDDLIYSTGRASIIDWALKDKYTASDVTRWREAVFIQQKLQGISTPYGSQLVGSTVEDFNNRLARDDAARRRKLDYRLEWLVMEAMGKGKIVYNDGKIKFTVDYGRPANQQDQAPDSELWSNVDCDPIGDLLLVKQYMLDTYGIIIDRGILSEKIVNNLWKSKRFLAAVGMPFVGGTPSTPLDPNYLGLSGYNPAGALRIVEQATGITFTIYDGYYQTRAIGSKTFTTTRFLADDKLVLYPSTANLGEVNDTAIGFAKTLTAPHPEGNWSSGFYEWEDEERDPWLHVRGSGIKAFPVFPYMQYTYVLDVL